MSDPTSTHKVAAVTGGMGGIGQGIVVALTQRDFDVVVCDRTIDPAIAESMTTNAAPGARLSFVKNDLADSADLPRFVDEMFAAFGHLDCLVNNAGVSAKSRGDLLDVSAESYDLNFTMNTRGAFFLTQTVCKKMLAAEGEFPESARSVIFISSSNAVIAAPERGEYAMSKAAVAMISFSSRASLLSTAGARPKMSGAPSRQWLRVNFPSQPAPRFRSMAGCTSTNTEAGI